MGNILQPMALRGWTRLGVALGTKKIHSLSLSLSWILDSVLFLVGTEFPPK